MDVGGWRATIEHCLHASRKNDWKSTNINFCCKHKYIYRVFRRVKICLHRIYAYIVNCCSQKESKKEIKAVKKKQMEIFLSLLLSGSWRKRGAGKLRSWQELFIVIEIVFVREGKSVSPFASKRSSTRDMLCVLFMRRDKYNETKTERIIWWFLSGWWKHASGCILSFWQPTIWKKWRINENNQSVEVLQERTRATATGSLLFAMNKESTMRHQYLIYAKVVCVCASAM